MNQFVFANNVQTTLAAAITSATQTTIELSSTQNIPAIPAGYYWALTLNDAATQTFFEIVYVYSTSSGNLQVLRGQEGTTARTWSVNDLAYSCATAGVLASFLSAAQAGNFVALSPPSMQTGFISISGGVTAKGLGSFIGADLGGGALSSATNGSFSGEVSAAGFTATQPYTNAAIGALAILLQGGATVVGVGPSSGLSAQGITASALAIGSVSTGNVVAIDTAGNLGAAGNVKGTNGTFTRQVSAQTLSQNGNQVVDTITSSTLEVNKTGGSVEIELINSGVIPVGGSFVNDGNGGSASISLPNYGQWFIEVIYAVTQTSNTNLTITLSLTGGTITSGFQSNAPGVTAYNSNAWITIYGKGHTTVNNQTLTFGFTASGGSLANSPAQPWTVRATRTA